MKQCYRCKKTKENKDFYNYKRNKDGLSSACKFCVYKSKYAKKDYSYESYNHQGKRNPMFGKKHSEEAKRKIALGHLGKKVKPFTGEHKQKIGLAHRGKKLSEKTKQLLSKTWFKRGHISWIKGKTFKEVGRIAKGVKLEKHWNWKGGISFEPYSIDWTQTLKKAIRERDKYTCKICGLYGFDVHHIDYNKKNCNSDNLITLCHSCHIKTNYNRNYWQKFFNQ